MLPQERLQILGIIQIEGLRFPKAKEAKKRLEPTATKNYQIVILEFCFYVDYSFYDQLIGFVRLLVDPKLMYFWL